MRPLNSWKVPVICALTVVGLPLALAIVTRNVGASGFEAGTPEYRAASLPARAQPAGVDVSLRDALGRNWLQAQYRGNGHNEVRAIFTNRHEKAVNLTTSSGLIFETVDFKHQMVLTRGETIHLAAGEKRLVHLSGAATKSSNPLTDVPYQLCPDTLPNLAALFQQVDKSPEVSRDAIQTGVLLLDENAPLGMFAKFSLLTEDPATPRKFPAVYQANTSDILAAFDLLREAGYSRLGLTAAHDPQLKIEAMIDPLSHAAALHYYNIKAELEWAYWRDELQSGDVSTRHYALYGIGRYFPEVALQMLPMWARAQQLSPLLRSSAIQAMAETHRPEAISVLQQLVSEFGAATEFGASARKSIAYLENQRAPLPATGSLVEFRVSQADVR